MKPTIIDKLKTIENEHKIDILFAVESGSRAWGFPSTDSDYDVRFIYKRRVEDYLKINEIDDFIDFEIENELDFKAWDIQKVLRLMLKSNASILEYLQSPIHYIINEVFEKELFDLAESQFNPQKVARHYLGITTRKLIEIEHSNKLNLKNLFYALRSVLAAKWIIEEKTLPPMEFKKLDYLIKNESISAKIKDYLKLKYTVDESFLISKDIELINWIIELNENLKSKTEFLPKIEFDKKRIDDFFLKTIAK